MPRVDRKFLNWTGGARAVLLAVLVSLGFLLQPYRAAASDDPNIERLRICAAPACDAAQEPAAIELEPNETKELKAFAVYDDDSEKEVTGEVTFESRDEEV